MEKDTKISRVGPKNTKSNIIYLCVGIVLVAVGVGLAIGCLASSNQDNAVVLLILGFVALVFGIGLLIISIMETKRYHNTHCKECGHLLDVTDEQDGGVSVESHENGGQFAGAKRKEKVEFDCKCPNCGTESHFTKTFVTATEDKNGNVHGQNINTMVSKYWKYKK